MSENYDCIIIGGGPAGLAAALYASRDRFKTLILEKFMPGGQINLTERIENYPGIESIDGPGLVAQMQKQAESFGTEIKNNSEVTGMEKLPDGKIAVSCDDDKYVARAVILAPGSDYRNLGVPGEEQFRGSGVSYCGTCDAPFFRGKHVVSVGGGNTALEETLHLAKFAQKVTMIHRRDEFRAAEVLVEELLAKANEPNSNLTIKYSTVATAINGQNKVESATLKNVKTGRVLDKTFRAGEKITEVRLETHSYQYLYSDGDLYTFMHNETFEQLSLPNEALTDAIPYLKENDKVSMLMRDEKPVTVEVANHVELLITKCDPGVRGDTAQGGTKPATLETGLTVQVPLFVEEGETIRVDTRTGDYMNRV